MSKQDLSEVLWPETSVGDGSLANLVLQVRRSLGDERGPRLLRTVHGIGYAFWGEAEDIAAVSEPAQTMFRVVVGEREIGLREGENWIGRSVECRVRVCCSRVSRRHARIVITDGEPILEDRQSRNGTFLRGHRIVRPVPLQNRDKITVGSLHLFFQIVPPDAPTDAD